MLTLNNNYMLFSRREVGVNTYIIILYMMMIYIFILD